MKLFSKFFKDNIDEKLIIMGSYGGIAFLDNTRHLYDFLKKHSDYKLVWLTRSRELLRKLREKGINALYTYDLRANSFSLFGYQFKSIHIEKEIIEVFF